MSQWESNSACILDYLHLFRLLAQQPVDEEVCVKQWKSIQALTCSTPASITLAPRTLQERFQLHQRELLLVIAALALEMDVEMRTTFRTRYGLTLPTVEYGLQLIAPLCPNHVETLAELAGSNPIIHRLLIPAEWTAYPLERPLILCRAAFTFLTGLSLPHVPELTCLLPREKVTYLPLHAKALRQVKGWWKSGSQSPLYLQGSPGCGRRTLLLRACGGAVCLDLDAISSHSRLEREHLFREADILSTLLSVPVCAISTDASISLHQLEHLRRHCSLGLVIVLEQDGIRSQAQEIIRLSPYLTAQERNEAWLTYLPQAKPDSIPCGSMSIGGLLQTAQLASRLALSRGCTQICIQDTQEALRQRGSSLSCSIHIHSSISLEDMVLPQDVAEQIQQICFAGLCGPQLASWKIRLPNDGVTAVFHGPSGTGKTMAAHAIAHRLGKPLLRADLSQIMDKYVGETEKHLSQLMQSARENRCVLLFDEADSLFGKRSSGSSCQDKYANLSTSFLLQELEQYDGVALLSTNLLNNFDDAFLRRLQYVVRFRLPDPPLREQLWRQALPLDRMEEAIPFSSLAQAELSPARIHSVIRCAAISAIAQGQDHLDIPTLILALATELQKDGKPLPRELNTWISTPSVAQTQYHLHMLE